MSSRKEKSADVMKAKSAADVRAKRLAVALRANLKRRKRQIRDRSEPYPETADEAAKAR